MLSIYKFKPAMQRGFRWLAGNWMTPDMAIWLGVATAVLIGLCFWLGLRVNRWWLLATGPLLIMRMAFNALDGALAREKGVADARGEALNELTDVGGDCISYLPVAVFTPNEPMRVLAFAVVIATLLAEFAGILGKVVTGTRRYEGPLGGKSDRAFWWGLGAIIVAIWPSALHYGAHYLAIVFGFVMLTWLNRLRAIWKEL